MIEDPLRGAPHRNVGLISGAGKMFGQAVNNGLQY
jgi:hypothetical protein